MTLKNNLLWLLLYLVVGIANAVETTDKISTTMDIAVPVQKYVYSINPGDILNVSVWNEEKLTRELRVLPDGTINFPLAGKLTVIGKSFTEVQSELKHKLSEYITEPEVNVSVKSPEGNVVYVIGQVQRPGNYIMYKPMNVMQLLSHAGGLTPFASENNIMVLRKAHDGEQSIALKFEYGEIEDGKQLDKNYLLENGDVIVVP